MNKVVCVLVCFFVQPKMSLRIDSLLKCTFCFAVLLFVRIGEDTPTLAETLFFDRDRQGYPPEVLLIYGTSGGYPQRPLLKKMFSARVGVSPPILRIAPLPAQRTRNKLFLETCLDAAWQSDFLELIPAHLSIYTHTDLYIYIYICMYVYIDICVIVVHLYTCIQMLCIFIERYV